MDNNWDTDGNFAMFLLACFLQLIVTILHLLIGAVFGTDAEHEAIPWDENFAYWILSSACLWIGCNLHWSAGAVTFVFLLPILVLILRYYKQNKTA